MTKREELVALANRLEHFQRVLESARAGSNKTISVWSGDPVVVAESVAALRAQASASPPEREAALTRTQFVVQMILCYARIYPEITTTGAMARAAETFRAFLSDEKIEFGDARYAWDSAGAANIVYGYEGVDLPKPLSSRNGGEAKSSDGGVEGHAERPQDRSCAREPTGNTASSGQAIIAGIKPGPSEAPSTIPAASQEYVLRAMAKNYQDGNSWDHLDRETVIAAADEIKTLRAAIDRIPVPPSPVQDEAVAIKPKAWIANDPEGGPYLTWSETAARNFPNPIPLYTRPPAKADAGEIDVPGKTLADAASEIAAGNYTELPPLGDSRRISVPGKTAGGITMSPVLVPDPNSASGQRVEWKPAQTAPAPEQSVSVEELALSIYEATPAHLWMAVTRTIARALLDKYSIRSAMMTEGK